MRGEHWAKLALFRIIKGVFLFKRYLFNADYLRIIKFLEIYTTSIAILLHSLAILLYLYSGGRNAPKRRPGRGARVGCGRRRVARRPSALYVRSLTGAREVRTGGALGLRARARGPPLRRRGMCALCSVQAGH